MSRAYNAELLAPLSALVAQRLGLSFPEERWSDLERAIAAAAKELGLSGPEECLRRLVALPWSAKQQEVLAGCLTVGETYFFRDAGFFEALESRILPELIMKRRKDKRLRLWSAGCCTGEEAYSLAILLTRTIPDLADWDLTLLATDINPRFLEKAAAGIFGEWSFRQAPAWLKEKYFRKTSRGRYRILPAIAGLVSFARHNLADDRLSFPSGNLRDMDLIFCRNTLMYFTAEQAEKSLDAFRNALSDGGLLSLGPCDASHITLSGFIPVRLPAAVFYKKKAAPREAKAESLPSSPLAKGPRLSRPFPAAPAVHSPKNGPALSSGRKGEKKDRGGAGRDPLPLPGRNRQAEAEEKLMARLARSPDDASAMGLLARLQADGGRLPGAREWCEKAIARDRLNPAHYLLLGTILQEQGETTAAIRALRQTLYLEPDFILAHYRLGHLTLGRGEAAEAKQHFRIATSLLSRCRPEEILPGSDGTTAGRLLESLPADAAKERRK